MKKPINSVEGGETKKRKKPINTVLEVNSVQHIVSTQYNNKSKEKADG